MDNPDALSARGKQNGHANGHDTAKPAKAKPSHTNGKNGKSAPAKTAPAPHAKAAPDAAPQTRDWSKTLFLPETTFGMKAGLPELEPKLLARWQKMKLYKLLRKTGKGREKFVLHDGPPYANAHIHVGTALNKILKDAVTRSRQVLGYDSNYVPGFDCHGLPIEWKVEEQYRAKGQSKDAVPIADFRRECREYAQHWIGVQTQEFKRLGVEGDWDNYYATMKYEAEAAIAGELLKFAMNGTLYRGSKPVMWSVVEGTALAEAEIEYHEVQSPAIWVKFPLAGHPGASGWGDYSTGGQDGSNLTSALNNSAVVIWTTTPWTIPANRAISFSATIKYAVFKITAAPEQNWASVGSKFLLAESLAPEFMKAAKVISFERLCEVPYDVLRFASCLHPLHDEGYEFNVPLLVGDHVTETAGTGFVHTAPGHGADDFDIWIKPETQAKLRSLNIDGSVPDTVAPDGYYRPHVPMFGGEHPKRVMDDKGSFGKLDDMRYANAAVIAALKDAGMLAAMNPRYKHDYPHSWRSKAPVIFRNTPQWFIAIDKPIAIKGVEGKHSIRELALKAIADTRFVPPQGRNRIGSMIEARPDYVISRQRVWGVPIAIFVHKTTGEILPNAKWRFSKTYIKRLTEIFTEEGVDPWFDAPDRVAARFLFGLVDDTADWEQVRDTLDVWFDSASTHVFVLKKRKDLKWPADVYLEGSDQHRGWFHSTLLESCGTVGRAPYDTLVTHGFTMDEHGRKMSKSLGNTVAPQDVINKYGADILRLWALSTDYTEDQRIGPTILQGNVDAYRKTRNTLRYVLGNLAHYKPEFAVAHADMPELERWVLHRVSEVDAAVRQAYLDYDFKRAWRAVSEFCNGDLSALYFDIRKDTLYCEPYSSAKRHAALTVLDILHRYLCTWLEPILCFTTEEAWLARFGEGKGVSVHLETIPEPAPEWRDEALAAKWENVWRVRRVITGALEVERREKRIGSSLEAAPEIAISDKGLLAAVKDIDFAEIAITSAAKVKSGKIPEGAFTLPEVPGVAVLPKAAKGKKCARSWRITQDVGLDPEYPELSARDAAALREYDQANTKIP
jgi:isoleucyl-tRNA synthetase